MHNLKIAMITTAWAFAIFTVLGLFMSGCASIKPGGACKDNAAVCADKNHATACEGGKYVSYSCTGPLGCEQTDGGAVLCDQSSGAAAGSACAPPYNRLAQCAGDNSAVLLCQEGAWQPLLCPAGTTCQRDATSVWCG